MATKVPVRRAFEVNWRGRPLTSHEVVVQTIAATRTGSGLRVEAVLDPGDYPTGVAISKERFAALPVERHATHGAWNYTLHPATGTPTASEGTADQRSSPAHRRQEMLGKLNDERLTGMTSAELACLCAALAPFQAARAQQLYCEQREGRARRATGNPRGKPLFDDPARVLLTLIYQRLACSMNVLADLLCTRVLPGQRALWLKPRAYPVRPIRSFYTKRLPRRTRHPSAHPPVRLEGRDYRWDLAQHRLG